MSVNIRCTETTICDFHRNEACFEDEEGDYYMKCPYYCDAEGCFEGCVTETDANDDNYCEAHRSLMVAVKPAALA